MQINKKAIIVEDNLIMSILYENYLQKMVFHTVGEIKDGKSAVELVRKYSPDVVIMDIKLQGNMDGITASQKIREFSDVPIIFITGNSDAESKERAMAISNSDFLVKPVTEEKLREVVNRVFGEEDGEQTEG
jgi:CheY-like chemotaxis protein